MNCINFVVPMNPCPCGFYPDRSRCSCNEQQVRRYLGKISRPLLERIDICVETSPVSFHDIRGKEVGNESSARIRQRVEQAKEIQRKRFEGSSIFFNSEMGSRQVRQYCALGSQEEEFLQRAYQAKRLSARSCHKILKVARTIADLDGAAHILKEHLCEAVSYRDLEEKYWGKGV